MPNAVHANPMQQYLEGARAAARAALPQEALRQAEAASQLAFERADLAAQAEAQSLLVQNLFSMGRFDDAQAHGERAAAYWLRLDRPGEASELIVQTAMGWSEQGESKRAMELARRALTLVKAHAQAERLPRVLSLIGGLHGRLGEWAEGEALLLQALSLARDTHDDPQEVVTLNALVMHLVHACEAHRAERRPREAAAASARLLQHARRALALSADEPQPFRRVVLRSNAGAALLDAGLADEAAALLQDVVAQAAVAGYTAAGFRARARLVRARLAQQQLDVAESEFARLTRAMDTPGHPADPDELDDLAAAITAVRQARQEAPVIQPSTGCT